MKKIAIITGASGFLGSHLVKRLVEEGFRVRAFDLDEERFAAAIGTVVDDSALELIAGDVLDIEAADNRFSGVEIMFHCAGIADHVPSAKFPERYLRANVHAVMRVMEAARYHQYRKVVYPSSAAIYGSAQWPTHEEHPVNPVNPYGLSKWMGEEIIDFWSRSFRVPALSFRIFNGYGPGAEHGSVINSFIQKKLAGKSITITGDGSQRRDFIYISDIVDAFVCGALSDIENRVFNLGSGTTHSLLEIAKLIDGEIEFIAARVGEPKVICPNISRLQNELGWKAKTSLDKGIKKTIEFYGG